VQRHIPSDRQLLIGTQVAGHGEGPNQRPSPPLPKRGEGSRLARVSNHRSD